MITQRSNYIILLIISIFILNPLLAKASNFVTPPKRSFLEAFKNSFDDGTPENFKQMIIGLGFNEESNNRTIFNILSSYLFQDTSSDIKLGGSLALAFWAYKTGLEEEFANRPKDEEGANLIGDIDLYVTFSNAHSINRMLELFPEEIFLQKIDIPSQSCEPFVLKAIDSKNNFNIEFHSSDNLPESIEDSRVLHPKTLLRVLENNTDPSDIFDKTKRLRNRFDIELLQKIIKQLPNNLIHRKTILSSFRYRPDQAIRKIDFSDP